MVNVGVVGSDFGAAKMFADAVMASGDAIALAVEYHAVHAAICVSRFGLALGVVNRQFGEWRGRVPYTNAATATLVSTVDFFTSTIFVVV